MNLCLVPIGPKNNLICVPHILFVYSKVFQYLSNQLQTPPFNTFYPMLHPLFEMCPLQLTCDDACFASIVQKLVFAENWPPCEQWLSLIIFFFLNSETRNTKKNHGFLTFIQCCTT